MDKLTFEQAVKRLEEIIELLEDGKTTLEKSVDLFQEGIELVKVCNGKLSNIEDKVAKIYANDQLVDVKE